MDKFSELKAAAMAATPGPWILDNDSWSEGDNANVSTEERYDGRIVSIAQIEGGGSESGFDEPFSTEQQANARYITAANPAAVLALLAELEAKDKRIAELERARFIAWPGAMFAPVLARIKVDVKRRDGSVSVGQSAGNVVWYHSDSTSDVVAFALTVEGDE